MSHPSKRLQSGAIAMIVALWMGVAMACLAVVDLANLFWQKREIQKIADLAALAGALGELGAGACEQRAYSNAMQNGWRQDVDVLRPVAGLWAPGTRFAGLLNVGAQNNACGVEVLRTVPYFFLIPADGHRGRTLRAEAIAIQQGKPAARLFIRSALATVSSGKPDAALLNALVGGLLGGSLNLSAVSWESLANTDIQLLDFLEALRLNLNLDAASYKSLLNTDIGIGDLVDAVVLALQKNGASTASGVVGALSALRTQAHVSPLRLRLGQLLRISASDMQAALATQLNVLGLLQAMIQVGNGNHAGQMRLRLPLGALADADVYLQVIEPPQWGIGEPIGLAVSTAQIKLAVDLTLLGVGVQLDLEVGGGSAVVSSYSCDGPDTKHLTVDVSSSAADIFLKLDVLGTKLADVPVSLLSQTRYGIAITPPQLQTLESRAPRDLQPSDWIGVSFNSGLLASLLNSVKNTINGALNDLGGLGSLLGIVLGSVVDLLSSVIAPLLDPVLNVLLKTLGVDLAVAEVAGQLSCGYRSELVS